MEHHRRVVQHLRCCVQARLLEHNVRFGDPECQCLVMRLQSDLLEVLLAAADGQLSGTQLQWSPDTALTVSMPTLMPTAISKLVFPSFYDIDNLSA